MLPDVEYLYSPWVDEPALPVGVAPLIPPIEVVGGVALLNQKLVDNLMAWLLFVAR